MNYLLDGEETARLIFRKIKPADFNDWLDFHKDPEASRYWISEKEDAETMCRKWYEKQFDRYENNMGGMNALIEKESNALTGHCGLLVQVVDGISELEIAYSLLPKFWHRGYATEAAGKCMEFAFKYSMADSLISIISLANIPSKNVAIKIGMTIDKTTVYNGNTVEIFRILRPTGTVPAIPKPTSEQ